MSDRQSAGTALERDQPPRIVDATLPHFPTSLRRGRRLVADACIRSGNERLADAAALLTGELIADAVQHGHAQIRVRLVRLPRAVRAEVTPAGPLMDAPTGWSPPPAAQFARRLIEAFAENWGHDHTAEGVTGWVEIAIPESGSE